MPREHFVVIPSKIVRRNKPERLQLYCDIYLLEMSNTRWSIADLARDRGVTYAVAYNLLREARTALQRARKRKPQEAPRPRRPRPEKQPVQKPYKNHIKNIPDSPRTTGVPLLTLIKSVQNVDKERTSTPRTTGVSDRLKLELETRLTTNCKILSRSELDSLTPRERMIYIDLHGDELRRSGVI